MQRVVSLIYPEQCVLCPNLVDRSGALCPTCWGETPFLHGLVCDQCGASLPGTSDGEVVHCDDCLTLARPWHRGRAALSYRDGARRFVLALKHSDRVDLALPAAEWMLNIAVPILTPDTAFVPVPAFWTRLLSRRYNQAAEIARALGMQSNRQVFPDALTRARRTAVQDGMGVAERFENMEGAIVPHQRNGTRMKGRNICLVDDVMTSGATLSVAARACLDAGAKQVSVLVLARVEKRP